MTPLSIACREGRYEAVLELVPLAEGLIIFLFILGFCDVMVLVQAGRAWRLACCVRTSMQRRLMAGRRCLLPVSKVCPCRSVDNKNRTLIDIDWPHSFHHNRAGDDRVVRHLVRAGANKSHVTKSGVSLMSAVNRVRYQSSIT